MALAGDPLATHADRPGFSSSLGRAPLSTRQPIYAQHHQGPKGSEPELVEYGQRGQCFLQRHSTSEEVVDVQAAGRLGRRRLLQMSLTGQFYFLTGNLQLELAGSKTVEGRLSVPDRRRPSPGQWPVSRRSLPALH